MNDDALPPTPDITIVSRKQPDLLPARAADFLRTKPRKPASQRGLKRDWSVINGIGYRMDVPDLAVTFDVARVRTRFDEIWGLLTVRAQFAGAKIVGDNILTSGDFSFSNVRGRHGRAEELSVRSGENSIDWRGLVEELCIKVLLYEERGEPEVSLADIPIPAKEYSPEIMAAGMPLLKHHPVIWFGDGGAAKSMLALYAAIDLAEQGMRVLYCDWELTAEEHVQRAHQLVADTSAFKDSLFYRRCSRPFIDDILPIRDIIAKRRIEFLICDSLSFGAKPPIESSESATGYLQALRQCGAIGSLHIAHMNRSDQGDQKPFGSNFWHNAARATYFLKRGEESPYPNEITVGCYHRKANLTAKHPPFAQRLVFHGDRIEIGPGVLTDDSELAKPMSIREKLTSALRDGPLTEALALSECQPATADGLRKAIDRSKGTFERFPDVDGLTKIRLVHR